MAIDIEQLKRDAFMECERRGYVMLSRELAREVFTAIPSPQDRDRAAALETMLGAAQRHCQRVESERDALHRHAEDAINEADALAIDLRNCIDERDALRAYALDLEAWLAGCTSDPDAVPRARAEAGVTDLLEEDLEEDHDGE